MDGKKAGQERWRPTSDQIVEPAEDVSKKTEEVHGQVGVQREEHRRACDIAERLFEWLEIVSLVDELR